MKKILFLLFIVASLKTFAQSPVKFTTTKYNFGKIKQNIPKSCSFTFKNISAKPLIIENAVAGCGCTTPEYPKEPIAKGKDGVIKVTYNAANLGAFTKDVTVKFVNIETPVVLNIIGEVIDLKELTTPKKENNSAKQ
jgi:hypothetical protein